MKASEFHKRLHETIQRFGDYELVDINNRRLMDISFVMPSLEDRSYGAAPCLMVHVEPPHRVSQIHVHFEKEHD